MKENPVLVVADGEGNSWDGLLEERGFTPLIRRDMQQALEALHYGRFAAVCIDVERAQIDVLECVLNIRDVAGEIPVLVSGLCEGDNLTPVLKRQPGLKVVDMERDPKRMLEAVFNGEEMS